ncbi:MAG: hypothetical protein AABY49_09275 [Planctomycetota bacterium]
MFDDYQYGYGCIFFLISIGCGLASSFRYVREKRFLESFIILAAYFFPPCIFFAAISPLSSLLRQLPMGIGIDENLIDGCSKIVLSPLIFFWVLWLLLGGYALFDDDMDLIGYLRDHFRKRYIQSKIAGLSLMVLGLLLFFLPFIYLGTGILLLPFTIVGLLTYFRGAIYVALLKDSAREIDELIGRMKNRLQKR